MKHLRTIALAVLVLALVAAGGGWLTRGKIAEAMFSRMIARNMAADPVAALPDGLHVGLCGAGSPMPDPTRAGPCTVVVAGRRLFVVDIGEGGPKNLALMTLPPARVDALFLTHFHSDHIADLGELMLQHWAGGAATAPLPIYGPQSSVQAGARVQGRRRWGGRSPLAPPGRPAGGGGAQGGANDRAGPPAGHPQLPHQPRQAPRQRPPGPRAVSAIPPHLPAAADRRPGRSV